MTRATLMLASNATGTESLLPVLAILALAAIALFAAEIFQKWLNSIISLLLTGVVAASLGPQGMNWLPWIPKVDEFANWGVTLLMFLIGIEFRLDRLASMWRVVVVGGAIQILLVMAGVAVALYFFGLPREESLFWGLLISMSSTALAVKLLELRRESETPAGRAGFAICSAQDIAILPMMLLLPLLAKGNGHSGVAQTITWLDLAKSITILLLLFFGGKLGFNLLIRKSAYTRNRALMIAVLGVICAGSAYVMKLAGLSPPLGALVAGLLVSRSEFAKGVGASVVPFRDILTPIFFLAIGMLISLVSLGQHIWMIALALPIVLLFKTLCGAAAALVTGYKTRESLRVGALTAQIGELSFVLAMDGERLNLLSETQSQFFVALAVASMAVTPLWMTLVTQIAKRIPDRLSPWHIYGSRLDSKPDLLGALSNHVIIAGGGLIGRMCVRRCESLKLPCVLIEVNPQNVDRINSAPTKGRTTTLAVYGDCREQEVLEAAGINRACLVVLAISHEVAALEAAAAIRVLNRQIPLLAKTRLLDDAAQLKHAGATHVVPEDLATADEMARKLNEMLTRSSPPRAISAASVASGESHPGGAGQAG